MSLLGNLVFFILGGFVIFLGYVLGGILLCLTIIGIPFGLMCFRLAGGVLAPFGREVVDTEPPGGPVALIMNIIGQNRLFERAAEVNDSQDIARVLRAFDLVLVRLASEDLSPEEAAALQAKLAGAPPKRGPSGKRSQRTSPRERMEGGMVDSGSLARRRRDAEAFL